MTSSALRKPTPIRTSSQPRTGASKQPRTGASGQPYAGAQHTHQHRSVPVATGQFRPKRGRPGYPDPPGHRRPRHRAAHGGRSPECRQGHRPHRRRGYPPGPPPRRLRPGRCADASTVSGGPAVPRRRLRGKAGENAGPAENSDIPQRRRSSHRTRYRRPVPYLGRLLPSGAVHTSSMVAISPSPAYRANAPPGPASSRARG